MATAPHTPEVTVTDAQGAMTATVSTESITQAPATAEGGELIAGKFKTTEDLIKAYGELEKKLGQTAPAAGDEAPGTETATENTDETPEDDNSETEDAAGSSPYGAAVTEVLTKAGLDPAQVATDFAGAGEISEDVYTKLAEAGYPREMVEAYRRGIQQTADTAAASAEVGVAEIKAAAGGEADYAKLQSWMASNMSEADLTPYNEAVTSGDTAKAKAAVAEAAAKWRADVGVEGDLLAGHAPSGQKGYNTEAEWLADMAKPEYKTSATFRSDVAAKIAASTIFVTR